MTRFKPAHTLLAAALWLAAAASPPSAAHAAVNDLHLQVRQDRVDLSARGVPLTVVLKALAGAAELDIAVSPDLKPGSLSLELTDEPLEDALKRILQQVNYAAIYTDTGEGLVMTAVKVYPQGRFSGETEPLEPDRSFQIVDSGTQTVFVAMGREVTTLGGLTDRGIVGPSQSTPQVPADGSAPGWMILQQQLEREEMRRFEDLVNLQDEIERAGSGELRDTLVQVYVESVIEYQRFKVSNLNKIEGLKRASQLSTIQSASQ